MTKIEFEKRYKELLVLLNDKLSSASLTESEKESFLKLRNYMEQYNYENRKKKKGLLSRVIVDSLVLDQTIGEKYIEFDQSI